MKRFLSLALRALSKGVPVGALFQVCGSENSLLVVNTVLESCLLLPVETGIQAYTADKLFARVRAMILQQAGIPEKIYSYALDLDVNVQTSDFKATVNKKEREIAKINCYMPLKSS